MFSHSNEHEEWNISSILWDCNDAENCSKSSTKNDKSARRPFKEKIWELCATCCAQFKNLTFTMDYFEEIVYASSIFVEVKYLESK